MISPKSCLCEASVCLGVPCWLLHILFLVCLVGHCHLSAVCREAKTSPTHWNTYLVNWSLAFHQTKFPWEHGTGIRHDCVDIKPWLCLWLSPVNHCGLMTACDDKDLGVNIDSGNGLLSVWCQAIAWANVEWLPIGFGDYTDLLWWK